MDFDSSKLKAFKYYYIPIRRSVSRALSSNRRKDLTDCNENYSMRLRLSR